MPFVLPVLPVLPLICVWLYTKTHLMKSMAGIGWITSLFLVEEMVQPSVELLHSGVFVAVIALSVFHMLAFLRIHVFAYYALLFSGKIIRFALRFLGVIMSPVIMHMLIEDVVNLFIHIACQYNIHSFGMFVVGTFFFSYLLKMIVSLAHRFFGWIVVALSTIYFTATYSILWDILAMIGFLAISAATVLAIVAALESLAIVVRRVLAWLLHKGRMLSHLLRPHQPVVEHPAPLRPAPDHVFSITWSDGLPSSHLPFQPHTEGESISRDLFLLVKSKRNKQRLTKHVGRMKLLLSEISSLVKQVCFVDIDPTRRQAFRELLSRVDNNYWLEDRAQSALAELTLLFNELKGQYPRRFRPWSQFEKLYEECVLFQQGIDIIMLEIKLRAEFNPNKALDVVRNTMEEAEIEDYEAVDPIVDRTEANAPAALEVPPQQAAILPVVDNDEFQVDFDNPDDGGDEEVEEDAPAVRRHRRRSKVSLHSDLGSYWSAPLGKRTGTKRRTSSRVRRKPERFEP
jgi:hypothetical protein